MTRSPLPQNACLGPTQLAELRAGRPEIRLLDVRTAGEFERAHIEGAYNVPLDGLEPHAAALRQVAEPLVLVCRSDARARTAEELLRRAGVRNVRVLEGGMLAWRGVGLPVVGRPLPFAEMLRRGMGVLGLAIAVVTARRDPLLGVVLAYVALRLALGQSVLPCAVSGTCAVPGSDTAATVRALVEGRPGPDAVAPTVVGTLARG